MTWIAATGIKLPGQIPFLRILDTVSTIYKVEREIHACAHLADVHGRACDVSLEQVMGCGLGGCYSCVVLARSAGGGPPHHTRTCIEGPVFDAKRVVWEAVAGH